ncbi:ferredoxin [Kitasatospora sp. NPDC096147]|uniref:ferredoxin n=1 Tax=Kitasatospora sp. NPDC096147 TaxID=3364093 RepID=UPI0038020F42
MRIEIQPDLCVTSGRCSFTAPTVFTQDDDGIVTLLDENPGEDAHGAVRDAAYLCPAQAIAIRQ